MEQTPQKAFICTGCSAEFDTLQGENFNGCVSCPHCGECVISAEEHALNAAEHADFLAREKASIAEQRAEALAEDAHEARRDGEA